MPMDLPPLPPRPALEQAAPFRPGDRAIQPDQVDMERSQRQIDERNQRRARAAQRAAADGPAPAAKKPASQGLLISMRRNFGKFKSLGGGR